MAAETAPPRSLFVLDARFALHLTPPEHPERPERLDAARRGAERAAIAFVPVAAREATDEELARVHDPAFVTELSSLRGTSGYIEPDTYVSPDTIDVARLAAGAVVAMVSAMVDGSVSRSGLALVRPPGHHACRAQAMGFCLFNNVAVAAASAKQRGLSRIAIVDWDVHHGNGTQEIFYDDPSVLYVSTHQSPFYPGTGESGEVGKGDGRGFTINVPLSAGGSDSTYVAAFERIILPVLDAYRPELVLVSAGFDAAASDPLAQMQLSPAAYAWMADRLSQVADAHAEGRIALVLEGGYDLDALEQGVANAAAGMAHAKGPRLVGALDDPDVERAVRALRPFWPVVT